MNNELLEVSVKIIQARNLQIEANASLQVEVGVGEKCKHTKVVKFSDAPYFDEYFTFDYKLPLDIVLEKALKLSVKKHRGLLPRITLAEFSLPLRYVYAQEGHQIYHKWAPLAHPTKLSAGNQGHLKVDIRILRAGEPAVAPVQLDLEEEDFIEGNLILPGEGLSAGDRQFAEYLIQVYQADGISKLPSSLMSGLKRVVGAEHKETFAPLVSICLSDLQGQTSVQNNKFPFWNESLVFTDIFPPMWSNVRVQLQNYSSLGSTILAEHCIPLSGITHLSQTELNNFPPTFGPAYVHLYTEQNKYAGRILLSISTKILNLETSENTPQRKVVVSQCPPLFEKLKESKIAVFISLLEANMLPAELVDHKIIFQACFGSAYAPQGSVVSTSALVASQGDEGLSVLPIGETAPCLSVIAPWPNRFHSMFARNRLLRIINTLSDEFANDITKTSKVLQKFADTGTKFLRFLETEFGTTPDDCCTQLDILTCAVRKAALEEMVVKAKEAVMREDLDEQTKLISEFQTRLLLLVEDPQQYGIPDICVRLVNEGGKVLSSENIKPELLIHSSETEEVGFHSGLPFTVFMQMTEGMFGSWDDTAVSKIQVHGWLGLIEEAPTCIERLRFSCKKRQENNCPFPSTLIFNEKHVFECRAHIYQGSFVTGWDKSGLCDPFIRVSICNKSGSTQVISETLSPTWDQTLVLWPVEIWGDITAVSLNPPVIVMEALDQDLGKAPDYIGRIFTTPDVKLVAQATHKKPILEWYSIKRGNFTVATVLAAFELVQCVSPDQIPSPACSIRPKLSRYRLECLFWGIRGNTRIERACFKVECSGHEISSTVLVNVNRYSNFDKPHTWLALELPENPSYLPPFTIKLFNHRNLCHPIFEGVCMIPSLQPFLKHPAVPTPVVVTRILQSEFGNSERDRTVIEIENVDGEVDSDTAPLLKKNNKEKRKSSNAGSLNQNLQLENVEFDWWSKLVATESTASMSARLQNPELSAVKIKIYDGDIESQPEFGGFSDKVQGFPIVKGHRNMDENPPQMAVLKGGFSLLKLADEEDASSPRMSLLPPPLMVPSKGQQQTRVLARLYIVKCLRLRPKDMDGLSDPFITVSTSLGQKIKDRDNYVKGDLNPVFGKCYELELTLPKEHELIIGVVDLDDTSCDDLIGETHIDIEQRLMTKHRAHCGISARYDKSGYNIWRDGELPSQILSSLCAQYNLSPPSIRGSQLTVGSVSILGTPETNEEQLSLAMLHRWHQVTGWPLVPEHIESRPLFLPRKTGVEQGRLLMWLDLFPEQGAPPGTQVNITPRFPVAYELRVIVWNAENIIFKDTNAMGEKMSDIYFKCGLEGTKDFQETDVHYRSVSGEGQFNWRMVFPLRYLAAERRMVLEKHIVAGMFSRGEQYIPCTLAVQAWDADVVTADDFIGSVNLELCCLPPGAKSAKNCKLAGAESGPLNLFVTRCTRGWWPLRTDKGEAAGKVELELEIVKAEEAEVKPVGKGRDPPEPLTPPNRPDTSFLWFMNPARSANVLLRTYRKKLLCYFLFIILVVALVFSTISGLMSVVNKLFTAWL